MLDDGLEELAIASGFVAENVKKTIRDDGGFVCVKKKRNIRRGLGRIINILIFFCGRYETTLEACAELNIAKLKSRKDRNVLKGDGDNR